MAHDNTRFIEQAKGYQGKALRIARCQDRYGENHVVIEMSSGYFLDWIGAEYATEPDEFDEKPFTGLKWSAIKDETK